RPIETGAWPCSGRDDVRIGSSQNVSPLSANRSGRLQSPCIGNLECRALLRDADRRSHGSVIEVPIGKECLASQSARRCASGQFNGVRRGDLRGVHGEVVDQTVHKVTAWKAIRKQGQFGEVGLQGGGVAVVAEQYTVDVNVLLVRFLSEDKVVPVGPIAIIAERD